MPEPTTETPAETTPSAPVEPQGPTADELASTLQAERMRAMQLEQETAQLRQALYTRRDQMQPQQVAPGPDPLTRFTENVLTGDPAENRRMLELGLNQRIGQTADRVVSQVRQEVNQRMAAEREQMEAQRVLDRLMSRNPEVGDAKNRSAFAAMLTKAHIDAQEQGLKLSMDQIGERAIKEFRQVFGPKNPQGQPAYVEGVSSPGLAPGIQGSEQPLTQNALEKGYGMPAGEIEPITTEGMQKVTTSYVKDKNAGLRKKAVGNSAIVTLRNELGSLLGG